MQKNTITDTVVINLASRPERLEHAVQQHAKYQWCNFQVLVATTTADSRAVKKACSTLSLAESACFISHLRIWETFAQTPSPAAAAEWVLVTEDDAVASHGPTHTRAVLERVLREIPDQMDFVNLGGLSPPEFPPRRSVAKFQVKSSDGKTRKYALCNSPAWLYHAYLIRKSSCARWVQVAREFRRPIDNVHFHPELSAGFCVLVKRNTAGRRRPQQTSRSQGIFGQMSRKQAFKSDIAVDRNHRRKRLKTRQSIAPGKWYMKKQRK